MARSRWQRATTGVSCATVNTSNRWRTRSSHTPGISPHWMVVTRPDHEHGSSATGPAPRCTSATWQQPCSLRRRILHLSTAIRLARSRRSCEALTIPVVDDLNALGAGASHHTRATHHLETMTALLRFPGVPAVYFCHGWLPWEEAPPRFPRILRYVAVDHTVRDRLQIEHGIPGTRR